MLKKMFYLVTALLLCSSCVSRTTIKEHGLKDKKPVTEKKIVWFWDKDF